MITTMKIVENNVSGPRSLVPKEDQNDRNFQPNAWEFDVSILELNDRGELVNAQLLDEILQYIKFAREKNNNGVIVTLFAHGWHHGGDWNDANFVSFRKLLASLCLREAERNDSGGSRGRRIIGIYLAWNGEPRECWLSKIPILKHASFSNRYEVAEKIGSEADLCKIFHSLIHTTKSPLKEKNDNIISPLIFAGHSMGALIVESAFLSVLKADEATISDSRPRVKNDIISLKRGNESILAPDLIIALNSAADSEIAYKIKELLEKKEWRRIAGTPDSGICYDPPILISITSLEDYDTGIAWRFARKFHMTDGHNPDLFTHIFTELQPEICDPHSKSKKIDFGQCWHCIRLPDPKLAKSPNFFIDLPIGGCHERTLKHMRYKLCSKTPDKSELAWIFQIPGNLCQDHNDIFNPQMSSLMLALISISGAVMSLANEWTETFEP